MISVLLAFTIAPAMIGARIVNARNTGIGAPFLSVITLVALAATIEHYVKSEGLGILLANGGGAIFLAAIPGTTII